MAILLRGKSRCSICQKVINENDTVFSVPPLITNKNHPLFIYNDTIMLLECIEKKPEFGKLQLLIEQWEARSSGKISFLSNNVIESPEDFFAFPHIADDGVLSDLNFRICSKKDLKVWKDLEDTINRLKEISILEESYLFSTIKELESLMKDS